MIHRILTQIVALPLVLATFFEMHQNCLIVFFIFHFRSHSSGKMGKGMLAQSDTISHSFSSSFPNPPCVSVLLTKCPPPNAAPLPLISPEKRENGKKTQDFPYFFLLPHRFLLSPWVSLLAPKPLFSLPPHDVLLCCNSECPDAFLLLYLGCTKTQPKKDIVLTRALHPISGGGNNQI